MALNGVLCILVLIVGTAPALLPCEPGPPTTTAAPGQQRELRTPTALHAPTRTPTTTTTPRSVSAPRPSVASPSSRILPAASPWPTVTSTARPLRLPSTTPHSKPASTSAPRTPASPRPPASGFRPAASPGPTLPSTPSPEQLVARIRALVRALRDADQLLRALQMFRDQQQLGDDAVLRVMKEDANRTLVQQVEQAMRADRASTVLTMADIIGNLSIVATPSSNKTLSAKVPYSAYGKKSAKFVHGQQHKAAGNPGKTVPAVGKARSGVAAAASAASATKAKSPGKKHPGPRPATRTPTTTASPTARNAQSTTLAPGFSARTTYVSSNNGTVITRIKNDPILGEYKVVIRDLTPAASSGIAPRNASSTARPPTSGRRSDNSSRPTPHRVLLPPVTSTPTDAGRVQRRPQGASAPTSTTPTLTTPTSATKSNPAKPASSPPANRRSGKSTPTESAGAVHGKTRNTTKGKATTTTTTTPKPSSTSIPSTLSVATSPATSTPPPVQRKSFQKKATDRQQIVVSATLRTAPPKEREEESARERAPQDTPLLSGIFPRYGPGAELPHVERPFVPTRTGGAPAPANVLLPPLPDAPTTVLSMSTSSQATQAFPPLAPAPLFSAVPSTTPSSTTTSRPLSSPTSTTPQAPPAARDDARSAAGGGGPPQTVRLEPALSPSPPDAAVSYFLGESPWIPIFVPPQPASANEIQKQQKITGASPTTTAPPRTIVELTKLHVVEATPSAPVGAAAPPPSPPVGSQGRAVLNDALEWRPSRAWQYAVRQDRTDAGELQDLDHDRVTQQHLQQLQHLQLQLQPDLRLGGLSLVPVPLSVAESVYYRLTHVRAPGRVATDLQGSAANAFPYEGIPGVAGVDYPAHSRPPLTRFTCADFRRKGYFADPASGCQAFYVCHGDGRGEAMLCPNGTIFSQEVLVCDWWFNVDCKYSPAPRRTPPPPRLACGGQCGADAAVALGSQDVNVRLPSVLPIAGHHPS